MPYSARLVRTIPEVTASANPTMSATGASFAVPDFTANRKRSVSEFPKREMTVFFAFSTARFNDEILNQYFGNS